VKAPGIFLVLLALLLAGCGGSVSDSTAPSTGAEPDATTAETSGGEPTEAETTASELRTVTIDSSGGDEVEVRVEIANSPDEQARGLMGRTALAEGRGMLFVFPDEEVRSFWMRNTLIPLSIAFMDSEGQIVDLQDMKPLDDNPPHYVPAEPTRYALEVNRGFFEERGVEEGDSADLPR
jgi:uncharacterized membrane protein (UPF0127 family)